MLFALLSLFACEPGGDPPPVVVNPGEATACLGQTIEKSYPAAYDETPSWAVEGVVLSFGPAGDAIADALVDCGPSLSQVLRIEAPDTIVWTLGYGIEDPSLGDVSEPLDVAVGDVVSLTFRAVQSFGSAAGFVLTDAEGLVAALEVGTWGGALEPGDVPGYRVEAGEAVMEEEGGCGTFEHRQTDLYGHYTEPSSFNPGEWGPVEGEDGVTRWARAIQHFEYVGQPSCTDVAGAWSWAIWR